MWVKIWLILILTSEYAMYLWHKFLILRLPL